MSSNHKSDFLTNLPKELLSIALHLLDIPSLFSLKHVSKFFHHMLIFTQHIQRANDTVVTDIIVNKYTDLFEWILRSNIDISSYSESLCFTTASKQKYCELAAFCGSLDILKLMYFKSTADEFRFALFKRIHEACSRNENASPVHQNALILAHAAGGGHMEIVKWLRDNQCYWTDHTHAYAAARGDIGIMKYVHERCPFWNEVTCAMAARNGHLEMLKYLHENGCPWSELAFFHACEGHGYDENNYLEIVKYLHENGCPWDPNAYEGACRKGYLEVVKYLHQQGCQMDRNSSHIATKNGHLNIVKYIYENNLPRDDNLMKIHASESNHRELISYLRDKNIPVTGGWTALFLMCVLGSIDDFRKN